MSYARYGHEGSDVYVFRSGRGFECCGCILTPADTPVFDKQTGMIHHLQEHKKAGHTVPEHAIKRLREESERGGGEDEQV